MINYSVIIAERNEPDLKNTVANIKANSAAHVIVMSDKDGNGPQYMRDKGVELAAGSEVVIIMDGHMRVKPGALDAMAAWCMDNPKSVAVAECFHSYEQSWQGQPYSGARIALTDYGKDASEPQAFTAKWRKDHAHGQIPCVMGACYAFKRDWYMDGLRRPWRFGTGWGCDEEILSAATWLRGGTVNLLPVQVWHQARQPGKVPYKLSRRELLGVWANRLRILDMLPMSTGEREDLVRHIMPSLSTRDWREVYNLDKHNSLQVLEYNNFLSTGPMDWATFKELAQMETIKPMNMKELRKLAKSAGITVPFGCKKAELTKMIQAGNGYEMLKKAPKTEQKAPKKQPKNLANWGANEQTNAGGRCCIHCAGGNTTVARTMRSGRLIVRYRKCNECTKNFPTREILSTP